MATVLHAADDFVGTAGVAVVGRTPPTLDPAGSTWTGSRWTDPSDYEFKLNGTGSALVSPNPGGADAAFGHIGIGLPPTTSGVTVEYAVRNATGSDINATSQTFSLLEVQTATVLYQLQVKRTFIRAVTPAVADSAAYTSVGAAGAVITVRTELVGQNAKVFINGVERMAFAIPVTAEGAQQVKVSVFGDNSMDSIDISADGAAAASAFWTAFTGSHEII